MSVTYPLYIPDFLLWDRSTFNPADSSFAPDPYRDNPNFSRHRKAKPIVWLWSLLRAEVTRQRSTRLILPEPLLYLTLFGNKKPKDARETVTNALQRANLPWIQIASSQTPCVPRCPLYTDGKDGKHACGIPTRRHRHVVAHVPHEMLGVLKAFTIRIDEPDNSTRPTKLTLHWSNRNPDVQWRDMSSAALDVRDKRKQLWHFYYPVTLFGQAAGLSESCIRLFSAATKRIRFSRESAREDYGVLVPSGGVFGPNSNWIPCDAGAGDSRNNHVWNWLRLADYRWRMPTGPGGKQRVNRSRVLRRFTEDLQTMAAYGLGWRFWSHGKPVEPEEFRAFSINERMRMRLDLGLREDWLSLARRQLETATGLTILKPATRRRGSGIRPVRGTEIPTTSLNTDDLVSRIIAIRRRDRLSVDAVATEAEVSRYTLHRYITGASKIQKGTRAKLEKWLQTKE